MGKLLLYAAVASLLGLLEQVLYVVLFFFISQPLAITYGLLKISQLVVNSLGHNILHEMGNKRGHDN